MSMEDDINVIWQVVGWYMLQAKLQSAPRKIDNQWPFQIGVAISSHDGDSGSNPAKLVENDLRTNIAQMPDFISVLGNLSHFFRQAIVRVRQDKDAQGVFRFLGRYHSAAKLPLHTATCCVPQPHVSMHALICAMVDVT